MGMHKQTNSAVVLNIIPKTTSSGDVCRSSSKAVLWFNLISVTFLFRNPINSMISLVIAVMSAAPLDSR
uniref:Uncharacterized protein n=1 Tax=Glossina pallidipes TaxID=7398 RepID=A0A1B0ACH2_GLOPL